MLKHWIQKNILINFMTFFSFLILIFFMAHIFFGERSLWKIFELNHDIKYAQLGLDSMVREKKIILSEIKLLRDNNLDPDIISEISHKLLGLINSDQIVIDISK